MSDDKCIWHPFTQHGLAPIHLQVSSAQGAYLYLADGRKILDGISSWWVNLHGHCEPTIAEAIAKQAQKLEHVIFAGFTHEPAVLLITPILEKAKQAGYRLSKAFFSDNGSTSVEVALKMAFQYHVNRGDKNRTRFLALKGAYHGDTLGAMSVCEPEGFHTIFKPLLATVDFVFPEDISTLKSLLIKNRGKYAAIIIEPLVQGAGGMRMYSPEFLNEANEICKEEEVLFICDEVFTGFYRTGTMFASEHANISPDIICLSKGITGGFLPLAVTLATEEIFTAFLAKDLSKAFLHGHSYTANPLACAAGIASWKLLHTEKCRQRIEKISKITSQRVARLSNNHKVKNPRNLGTIGAIDLDPTLFTGKKSTKGYFSVLGPRIFRELLQRNVLLRPLGNVLYTVPPFCITDEEIHYIYDMIEDTIA